jgi:hypothetical protein
MAQAGEEKVRGCENIERRRESVAVGERFFTSSQDKLDP